MEDLELIKNALIFLEGRKDNELVYAKMPEASEECRKIARQRVTAFRALKEGLEAQIRAVKEATDEAERVIKSWDRSV
ncbi:MAG: hypothetical protein ABH832_01125 [bacterium]